LTSVVKGLYKILCYYLKKLNTYESLLASGSKKTHLQVA